MDERVTVADVRAAGFCVSGMRRWFAMRKIDFKTFVREGMPLADAEAINDDYSNKVLAARAERLNKRSA